MKEYTLIHRSKELNEDFSETETLLGKSHQNCEHSIDEHSDVGFEDSKLGTAKAIKHSGQKRKHKTGSNDSDSDFELPTGTMRTNWMEPKRPLRVRKTSYKNHFKEISSSISEELDASAEDNSSENCKEQSTNQRKILQSLAVPKDRFRKFSNDWTTIDSQDDRKHKLTTKKELSGFQKTSKVAQKPNPNFEYLVKAARICEFLDNKKNSIQSYEEKKILEPVAIRGDVVEQPIISLNQHCNILNLIPLDYSHSGKDVDTYFTLLRAFQGIK